MATKTSKKLRPRGAIGAYIIRNGKILLLLRSSKHMGGTWAPPGGHIEYGEDFLDAVKRETKEEIGIDISEIEIMGVTSDVYPSEKKHSITVHTRVITYKGTPKIMEADKCDDLKWFSLSKLPKNLFLSNVNWFSQNPYCPCGSAKKFEQCHGK